MTVEIRALRAEDDRNAFRSGDLALDSYFHRFAGQNRFRHHVGVTYVAVEDGAILGFVTLASASMDVEDVPGKRKLPPYPVPVLRVARLAASEEARGRGVAKALLRFSLELAERLRDEVGCVGLLVDAKTDAVPLYERFGFVALEATRGVLSVVPRAAPMFLPLGAVPRRRR